MDRSREIKRLVTMQSVAEHYGLDVNRSGFMRCPFHSGDRTASLKVYPGDRGWHCFGCGKSGSVIDFVMEYEGIVFHDACKKLDKEFHLNLYDHDITFSEHRKWAEERRRRRAEAEKQRERDRWCETMQSMWHELASLEVKYQKAILCGINHPLYETAVKNIDRLKYWLDEHPENWWLFEGGAGVACT